MEKSSSRSEQGSNGAAHSDELFQSGRRAEQAGHLDEARRSYELGLSYAGDHHVWQYRLGCVFLKLDVPEMAEPCFRQALEGNSSRAAYWANLGLALDRQGCREESIRAYRKASLQEGGSAVACHNLGSIYAEEGRTEEAIRFYEEAISLEPDAEGYLNLGLVHFAAEDFSRAMASFDHCVEADPLFALGHYYAGLCLMKRGNYEPTISRLETAWKLDPRLVRIPFHLGVCMHKLQCYDQARNFLERALESFPEDGRLHYQMALTCDAMGLPQDARQHFSRSRAAFQDGGSS
ncbi:MAG: tetratricopeptide repeat protein [Gemmatimonadales bacterium]|nr:tetratricopeptide repeat protein [Gemmatimonadales bacterium]